MLLLVLVLAAPPSLQSLLARVEQAIARKDFAAAEVVARQAVEAHPESRDARSTLAWVTLWNGHYREARALFRALPDDAATRLGLAQAEYWDGDLRAAQRGFAAVLELDPKNADARRALDEIRESSRPGFAIDVDALSDDQPYRSTAPRAIVYGFTDPLTKWIATAMIARFHRGGDAASIGGGIDTTHNRTTLRANASLFRFPDGARELLPRVEVLHPFGTTTLALLGERRELLRAASALRTHASVQTLSLRWSREHENKPAFAVRAEKLRYFDDNDGVAADAYVLIPWRAFGFGASVAYRDAEDFRVGGDPYYTPQHLREARVIGTARWRMFDVHADGGAGTSSMGDFHPWRASIGATFPIARGLTFAVRGEHNVTIDYTANEIHTSVAGRF